VHPGTRAVPTRGHPIHGIGSEMTEQRELRIAAVGDIHFDGRSKGSLRSLFTDIGREAQVLALCGDLTTHGEPEQVEALLDELEGIEIPIVAVLGNHDYESGQEGRICEVLGKRGIHVLDGTNVEIEGVGFAGVKGFGGGFGRRTLGPFGERIYKEFVQTAIDEALKLETALRTLRTETRVVVMHCSPIRETLIGEPEEIFPFLGSSRLLAPIETYGASVVFHGHAHIGIPEAASPGGVPVFNVARSVLEKGTGRSFRVWTATAPDRRQRAS
jgi:Icc-related predicted phosphoesterase